MISDSLVFDQSTLARLLDSEALEQPIAASLPCSTGLRWKNERPAVARSARVHILTAPISKPF